MSLRIDDEGMIVITASEADRLLPEWRASQQYTTRPCSFETWLRNRLQKESPADVRE